MSRPAAWVAGAAGLSVVAKLFCVWNGWFDANVVADDAYYYFTIAKNLAAGHGPTFDGLAPTNGFHPAWQLILVPFWWVWPHALWAPIHGALSLTTLLDLLSGLVLYRILSARGDRLAAAVAAVVWLLWPLPALVGVRGMEASLTALALLLLFWEVDALGRRPARWRDAVCVGALLAVCGLARTDHLLLCGLTLVLCVFGGAIRALDRPAMGIRWLAVVAFSALLVVTPWFAWSTTRFGSFLQVSAIVKARGYGIVGSLPDDWDHPIGFLDAASHALFAPLLVPLRHLCGEEFVEPRWFPVLAAFILLASVLLAGASLHRLRRNANSRVEPWVFPIGYMLLHVMLYGFFLRSYSPWYAQPYYAMAALVAGPLVAMLFRGNMLERRVLYAGGIVLVTAHAVGLGLFIRRVDHTPRGPELRYERFFESAKERLPGGRGVLGAFDAGAMGYLATEIDGVTVVNLDCLVNNAGYEALIERRYPEYVAETVDILVQHFDRFQSFLEPADYQRMRALMRIED